MGAEVSYGRQLAILAQERKDECAIVHIDPEGHERRITWRELDQRANQVARLLEREGVTQGSFVVVALPNTPEHFFADFAAWRLGATVVPLRWDLPQWDRDRLLQLIEPAVTIADWADDDGTARLSMEDVANSRGADSGPLPDRIPDPVRAIATSGSTGRPKLIVTPIRGVMGSDAMARMADSFASRSRTTELVVSPMYHTNGFNCLNGLLQGERLVVMQKFDARSAAELITQHNVNTAIMVPTMLRRIADLPDVTSDDFASIECIHYGGAPLPGWVADRWFQLIGPERFMFSYGGTEGIGLAMARGDEWLKHRGTVGKPVGCDVKIVGDDNKPLPSRSIGKIMMRRTDGAEGCVLIGADNIAVDDEGYATYGDLGWLDDDGYLFVADRRVDMIVTGGANVYPAEVELALSEHSRVADSVVVGLPDPEWGQRVHAIVEPIDFDNPPLCEDVKAHVRDRLPAYKVPKSVEFVALIPRTEAGKINRTALATERSSAATSAVD